VNAEPAEWRTDHFQQTGSHVSNRSRFNIFHFIETKTTLPRSSNRSGAHGLKMIFMALVVLSQDVIVSRVLTALPFSHLLLSISAV